jgi:UDP-3-O-[3-hydroxymyristoyl] glucosamine N-acyltransferase
VIGEEAIMGEETTINEKAIIGEKVAVKIIESTVEKSTAPSKAIG